MANPIKVPATLEGISTLKDGGASARFSTQELSDEDLAVLFRYKGKFGWLLFAESEQTPHDVEELEAVRKDTGGKSPSQRLRSALYVLYKQQADQSLTFEQFYYAKMEGFINHIKEKLT